MPGVDRADRDVIVVLAQQAMLHREHPGIKRHDLADFVLCDVVRPRLLRGTGSPLATGSILSSFTPAGGPPATLSPASTAQTMPASGPQGAGGIPCSIYRSDVRIGQRICLDYPRIPAAALLDGAPLRSEIDMDQAEALAVALGPFKLSSSDQAK